MTAVPCLDCGVPVARPVRGRCAEHAKANELERRARRKAKAGRTGSRTRWRKLWAEILEASPLCAYCGVRPATVVDHILPVSKGGDMYDRANLAPACKRCNDRKGSRVLS
jgi:5-methylcytosine-specific restriction endonuclease McrA